MNTPLTSAERKALKARAHKLDPILQIGGKGVTDAVIAEIGRALDAHELIKVRAAAMERDEREAALETICARLGADPVQHIGKILVLHRIKPEGAEETGKDEAATEAPRKPPRRERPRASAATSSATRRARGNTRR